MSFPISATGAWLSSSAEPHSFDEPLAQELARFFHRNGAHEILDVGCGSGKYVSFLRGDGFEVWGIDGNPKTPEFAPHCAVAELTRDLGDYRSDWVLCLEVGEHIPREYEQKFLYDLCSVARDGMVLSWFPTDGEGIGHVNPRPNDYIIGEIILRGFTPISWASLRDAASLWWFKHSLMAFKRT